MEELRIQQIEALDMAEEYIGKLIHATQTVTEELKGEALEDSKEYVLTIIQGINWTLQVLNRTIDVLNENELLIDKESVNTRMNHFSAVFETQDMDAIAQAFESDVYSFLTEFKAAIEKRRTYAA